MKKREIIELVNKVDVWKRVDTFIKLLVESGIVEQKDFYANYYYESLTPSLMFIFYSSDIVIFVEKDNEGRKFTNFFVRYKDHDLNNFVDRCKYN